MRNFLDRGRACNPAEAADSWWHRFAVAALLLGLCVPLSSCSKGPALPKGIDPTDFAAVKAEAARAAAQRAAFVAKQKEKTDKIIAEAKKIEAERAGKRPKLVVMVGKADGSEMKQIGDLPDYEHPSALTWSWDGKLVAFDTWKRGKHYKEAEIVVVGADGSQPRVVTNGCMARFSPGGDRILFSRLNEGGVWIMSTEGPDKELVQLDEQAFGGDWAADGRIVYPKNDKAAETGNLVVVDLVDGGRNLLFDEQDTPYTHIFERMAWSPDGSRIVFRAITKLAEREMGVVDGRGAKQGMIHRFVELNYRHTASGPLAPQFVWLDPSHFLIRLACRERANAMQFFVADINAKTNDPPELLKDPEPELQTFQEMVYSPDRKRLLVITEIWIPKT